MDPRQIVDFADEDNAKEMRDAFYSALQDKVMAHIDAHKKDVAQNLIAPETRAALQATETPTEAPIGSE